MSVVCPYCGTSTSVSPLVIRADRAFLPEESSERKAVYGKAVVYAITDDESSPYVSYGVFTCQECDERFVAKKHRYDDKEWVPVYPISHKSIAEEVPEPIKGEFEEASLCFAIGAYMACASMCQRTLESLCQDKQVPGLNELLSNGIISEALFKRATEIRLWAGITKHKAVHEPVSKEDAEELMRYLENVLDHVYVEPKRLDDLIQKRKQLEGK